MNKSAIQRFAIQARKDLIDGVSQRAYQYGITKDGYGERNAVTVGGRALTSDEQRQRKELVDQIVSKGYTQVMEEVAYTWFNRFIALRFMEVNNYLPSHIRVFSDSTGAFKPEILNDVLHLDLPGLKLDKVAEYIENNQTEDLYRYLLLTQCNALNEALPQMFERMGGFTELLLPNNILKQDSVLGRMVTEIPEEDWTDQIQIIGWMYQFYNTELKAEVFAKSGKIAKNEIPAATQLFTPDWIVRYMVENSLGRLWVEGHPNDELRTDWKYYLDEAEQEAKVQEQLEAIRSEHSTLKPQDIKVIDPCMGSGHILVYAFDVLVQIYKSYGISERDAARSILENNLYGLDIDDRAAQLAYFAVMMKARQYDRRIFSRSVQPHVYSIVESNGLDGSTIDYFTNNDPKLRRDFKILVEELRDAKEYGSILNISRVDFAALYARVEEVREDISIFREIVLNHVAPLIQVAEALAQKYDIVVTNPPYMATTNTSRKLFDYVKKNFPFGSADLFGVFIEQCQRMTKHKKYFAMITQHSWMFLSSYEKLRYQLQQSTIVNMAHLGPRAFEEISGEVVQTTSFIIRNSNQPQYAAKYARLIEFGSQSDKEVAFLSHKNTYITTQTRYLAIPGNPITYWLPQRAIENFNYGCSINSLGKFTGQQNITADNNKYLRYIWEINNKHVGKGENWIMYAKGGPFRRWYGNIDLVVDWTLPARKFYSDNPNGKLLPDEYCFTAGITYTEISSGANSFRYLPPIGAFDKKGPSIVHLEHLNYCLGFFNSVVASFYFKAINPTISLQIRDVKNTPIIIDDKKECDIDLRVDECVALCRSDWDSFETSWDFTEHPLVRISRDLWDATAVGAAMHYYYGGHPKVSCPLELCFMLWQGECNERFKKLKENEEELNRIFIDIYGLQDELTPEVDGKDVTVRKADLSREIRSFISYAVGCMFGRYSIYKPGLAYAGGEWDSNAYENAAWIAEGKPEAVDFYGRTHFTPDEDNILPICDDDYFEDDIVGRFIEFVEAVYGTESLEANLRFIADALGGKGTPREVIRNYFLNDFYADHLKIYQKRPIYWLFDSGKKNGFKALVYMHRYQSDLLARMRTDYVHEQQERYRTQLSHLAEAVDRASASERVKLNKQIKKIQEQALEIQKYEEKIHHLADQNISIDLDDGVKHNYELFADVLAKLK